MGVYNQLKLITCVKRKVYTCTTGEPGPTLEG